MPYSYRLALIPCVVSAALLTPDAARPQTPRASEACKGESSKPLAYIDTDTANEIDDPFAIYRALVAPEFHVVGLSSAGWSNPARFGANTRTSQKMNEELLGLLNLTDRISHPIGALKPMPGASTPVDSPAARDIIAKANAMPSGDKLQVFVLGCYTNVASALLLDPSIKDKISVHLMGFNFHDNRLTPTEFNSMGDLHAAAFLIKSGVELKVMVNTSMQEFHWTKDDVFAHFKGKGGVPEYLVNRWEEFCPSSPQRTLWDIAVFEAVLRPQLATLTEITQEGSRIQVWTQIDVPGMQADYWKATKPAPQVSTEPQSSTAPAVTSKGKLARIWKRHQDYLRGLHHFMSTDSRVPQWYRDEVTRLGLDARFHADTHGWPHQLYIRVARRLRGRYTITAHDVYNKTQVNDPIGLAQYGIDTYPSRRIWLRRNGRILVGIEGKMFIGGDRGPTNVPYPIPYRAITPRADECSNLLVPVCFSATHLGYASARMEPVFMICGESAGIAACRALAESTTVQKIDMAAYRRTLEKAGQKLTWDPAPIGVSFHRDALQRKNKTRGPLVHDLGPGHAAGHASTGSQAHCHRLWQYAGTGPGGVGGQTAGSSGIMVGIRSHGFHGAPPGSHQLESQAADSGPTSDALDHAAIDRRERPGNRIRGGNRIGSVERSLPGQERLSSLVPRMRKHRSPGRPDRWRQVCRHPHAQA